MESNDGKVSVLFDAHGPAGTKHWSKVLYEITLSVRSADINLGIFPLYFIVLFN